MNFLAAVAGFLGAIWLTYFIFVELENVMLGLGAIALVGMGFLNLLQSVKEK